MSDDLDPKDGEETTEEAEPVIGKTPVLDVDDHEEDAELLSDDHVADKKVPSAFMDEDDDEAVAAPVEDDDTVFDPSEYEA